MAVDVTGGPAVISVTAGVDGRSFSFAEALLEVVVESSPSLVAGALAAFFLGDGGFAFGGALFFLDFGPMALVCCAMLTLELCGFDEGNYIAVAVEDPCRMYKPSLTISTDLCAPYKNSFKYSLHSLSTCVGLRTISKYLYM